MAAVAEIVSLACKMRVNFSHRLVVNLPRLFHWSSILSAARTLGSSNFAVAATQA
jgi:hypothetical protein